MGAGRSSYCWLHLRGPLSHAQPGRRRGPGRGVERNRHCRRSGGGGHATRGKPKGAGLAYFVHCHLLHRLRIRRPPSPRRASAWGLWYRTARGAALPGPGGNLWNPVGRGRFLRLHLHLVRGAPGGHGCGSVLHRPGVRGHRKTEGRAREGCGSRLGRDGIRVGECHRQRRHQRGVHHSPDEEGRLPRRGGRGYRGRGKYRRSNPSPDHGGRSLPDRRVYPYAVSRGGQGGNHSRDSLHGNRIRLRTSGGGQEESARHAPPPSFPGSATRWPEVGTFSWPWWS